MFQFDLFSLLITSYEYIIDKRTETLFQCDLYKRFQFGNNVSVCIHYEVCWRRFNEKSRLTDYEDWFPKFRTYKDYQDLIGTLQLHLAMLVSTDKK